MPAVFSDNFTGTNPTLNIFPKRNKDTFTQVKEIFENSDD